MLFKKNKPDQPQSPNPSVQGQAASPGMTGGASSVFAPGLQARSAPIDFGFDSVPPPPEPQSYIVPAPPPDMFSQPEVQPAQADWNAGLSDDAQAFFTQSASPTQESWKSQQPGADAYISPEQAWGQSIIQESDNTAYLGETFESYVAQEPDFGLEAANAWQPPSAPESGFQSQTEYQTAEPILSFDDSAAFSATLDQMSPMPELMPPLGLESGDSMLGFGEPSTGMETAAYTSDFTVTTGEAMPWDQPQGYELPVVEYQSSVEALHNNLTAGNALPGEQVSVSPGALLDSMHQQFYPEDPFGMDQGDVLEGQQAFEEAAQFLFPDTVSASLDWQPEETEITTDYSSLSDFQMPVEPGFAPAPMDLGPSVQQTTSDMSDISGLYAGGMPPATPYASMTDQFSGLAPEPLESTFTTGGAFATGFESDPFSPDAFALEPASFAESPAIELNPPGMPFAASDTGFSTADASMSPPAYSADEFSTAFFPETTSAEPGYGDPLAGFEPVMPSEFSMPEMNIPVQDLDRAENWQPAIENYPNFSEEAALISPVTPELAIEAVPLDPFGDMESVHWDPVVAQQAEMMESIAPAEASQTGWKMPSVEYNPQDDWMTGQADLGVPAFVPEESLESSPMASNPTLEPVDERAFFSQSVQSEVSLIQSVSDQDFYATEFTLDEFGELVPVRETPIESAALPDMDMSAPVLESFEIEPSFPSLDLNGPVSEPHFNQSPAFEMPAPLPDTAELFPSNSELTLFEAVPADSFFEHPVEAMAEFPAIQPENQMVEDFVPAEAMEPMPPSAPPVSPFMQVVAPPLTAPNVLPQNNSLPPAAGFAPSVPPVQEPEHAPGSLEAQWHEPAETPAASTTQAGTVTPPAAFTLGNLEVLSVCPLAADRRLLVVHSNGVFALMGQVGLEQPQISVLKVFDNNPLAYQNTFTAVAEAQAAAQGMFVTQVGTWHAIVSTFQDKITLHTELG